MIVLLFFVPPSQHQLGTADRDRIVMASNVVAKVYKNLRNARPWAVLQDNPLSVHNNAVTVSFARNEPMRISMISRMDMSDRMRSGPKQGEAFKTLTEWEAHGFKQIQKVWTDIDGYLGVVNKVGEDFHIAAGRKNWSNVSNTMTLIWFTHPVHGLQRQFSVSMEMATGEPINFMCSSFSKAPRVIKKSWVLVDNSGKRKVKVGRPSTS